MGDRIAVPKSVMAGFAYLFVAWCLGHCVLITLLFVVCVVTWPLSLKCCNIRSHVFVNPGDRFAPRGALQFRPGDPAITFLAMASMRPDEIPQFDLPARAELYNIREDPNGDIVIYWRLRLPWRFVPPHLRRQIADPPRLLFFTRMEWVGWQWQLPLPR